MSFSFRFSTVQKCFCCALTCVAVSATAQAQSTGSIKGTVLTSDNQPAALVSIIATGEKLQTAITETKDDGTFTLNKLQQGTYTVSTSFVGLQPQQQTVTVVAGQTTTISFTLTESGQQLTEVTVNGARSINQRPLSISKLPARPIDIPQSMVTLEREVLERQQVQNLSDALQSVNGVYVLGTTGGYQEELGARGFNFGNSNTFKNGARFNNSIMPEMTGVERVEVLKGSNAILYGNVTAGGALNLVTKKPRFERGGEVTMRAGSFGYYKPSVDVYGGIGKSEVAAFRINGTYLNAGSFRDQVTAERFYVNPSFLFRITPKTEVVIEGDYLKDDRTPDFGTGAINYTIAEVPRERFLGVNWAYYKAEQNSLTATITHRFTNNWELRSTSAHQHYVTDLFANTRPNSNGNMVKPDGKWIRGVQRTENKENYYLTQLDLTGRFNTGSIGHAVLIGGEVDRYFTHTTAYKAITKYDSINIYNPNLYLQRTDVPNMDRNTLTKAPINRAGVYVQDLISLTDKLKVLAGVRYTYQETTGSVFNYSSNKTEETSNYDDAITPRFGIVYKPWNNTSAFASYSNSFTLNTGVDVSGKPLEPSFMDQYEVGVKNDLFNGMLSANLTAYQIVNSNLAQMSLENGNTNSNIKELAGEVTSKGIELDVMTKRFHGFSAVAGYSFNETKYTKSNIYIVGSKLRYNPAHTANATVFYNFNDESALKHLQVGLGAFFLGDRYAGRSTRLTVQNDAFKLIEMPNYTQFDAHIGYHLERLSVRLKVTNLLDKLSYYAHDDNSINPIALRSLMSTVSYRF